LTLLSLLGSIALFSYMSGEEQTSTPTEMMQKTTNTFNNSAVIFKIIYW